VNVKNYRIGVSALILVGLILGACENSEKSKDEQADAGAAPDQKVAVPSDVKSATPTTPEEPSEAAPATTASRGAIEIASCETGLTDVDSQAVVALYFDKHGKVVGTNAEDLSGTSDNKMCPTPSPSVPGLCQSGYCSQLLSGRKVCMPC